MFRPLSFTWWQVMTGIPLTVRFLAWKKSSGYGLLDSSSHIRYPNAEGVPIWNALNYPFPNALGYTFPKLEVFWLSICAGWVFRGRFGKLPEWCDTNYTYFDELTFSLDMVLAPNTDVLASSPTNVACPNCEGVSNRYSPGIRVFDMTTLVK